MQISNLKIQISQNKTMQEERRDCQSCKSQFAITPDDFGFYEKMQVPPPTFCPACRLKRRLAWRNGRTLFRRRDDASGGDIFSGFPPQATSKVFDHEYWKSDAWDAMEYGRDYDFSRSFFDQYKELLYSVPWPSKSVQGMVNSEYCDQAGFFKNSYLCFNGDRVEDSAYVTQSTDCKNCFDDTLCLNDELCYECVGVNGSYRTVYSENCESCVDVWFSRECSGCNNCFGCINLKNQSYCFLNEKCSKEEYERRIAGLRLDTSEGIADALALTGRSFRKYPVKYYHGFRTFASSGDYLRNTKNVKESYYVSDAEDGKYLYNIYLGGKDCYDYGPWGNSSSQMYECLTCGDQCNFQKFCFESWPACRNLEYCCFCRSSTDCFGCVSVKKKQYCILNKQYPKESFEELRVKIIAQMNSMPYRDSKGCEYRYGEFFPEEFSPFAYNETVLADSFPLSKEEALRQGYSWRDLDVREFATTMTAAALPERASDASDAVLKEVVQCGLCRRAYRIIAGELSYLKQMNLPLPKACINCRAARRAACMNPPKYHARTCQCAGVASENGEYNNSTPHAHGDAPCPERFETSYPPDSPAIVYCEQCYQQEIA